MSEDIERDKAIRDIELQLHEQYAQNNNANMSSIVTLLAAMLAVFYAFGYMYLHTSIEFSDNGFSFQNNDGRYTLDAMILTSAATVVTIFIMKYVCLYQGFNQRFEQFVTYAIRYKYYNNNPEKIKQRIYPDNYHPFKYKDNGCYLIDESEIPQGLFGKLTKLFGLLIWFIIILLAIKIILNIYHYNNHTPSLGILWLVFFLYTALSCFGFYECGKEKMKNKYYNLLKQYECYDPSKKNEITLEDNC